ncbi:uncharacterized protein LOC114355044 [Ostrinia furnacalis]|uniref:uncharacterized protein LOC114355044 n=1 Tax=Ostrinia furnacalis TaxID=93504 RepID=UPI00103B22EB|nr:uncharacterized protein LOC114355044 [Ostrinia furnacalis]
MSTRKVICGGCRRNVEDGKYLRCLGCSEMYDLPCAGFTDKTFKKISSNKKDNIMETWRCVACTSKQPKKDNTNTPVRGLSDGITLHRGGAARGPINLDVSESDNLNNTALNQTMEMSDPDRILLELRAFRDEMREEIRANRTQIERLTDKMSVLSDRVSECEARIERLQNRMDTLEHSNDKSSQSDNSALASIEQLRAELNDRDQDLLINDVEISCIPEEKGESLPHIVTTLASKLGVSIAQQDLVSVERVGRVQELVAGAAASRPRHIVVRLARRAVRDQLLQAARVRRGATTEGTGLPEPSRRFYINERLTKVNRQLFRRARELGGRLGWRFVWTREGRIYARRHHDRDSPRLRVRTESDLARVFGPDAVSPIAV